LSDVKRRRPSPFSFSYSKEKGKRLPHDKIIAAAGITRRGRLKEEEEIG
jgi:hypothetical protein